MSIVRFLVAAAALAVSTLPVDAQFNAGSAQPPDRPAHVFAVEGDVNLVRDGVAESLGPSDALIAGDRLTTAYGRAEILFADNGLLQLDRLTTIDLLASDLLRAWRGRLRLTLSASADRPYRIDTPAGSIHLPGAGEFLVTVREERFGGEVEVGVVWGTASLINEHGTTELGAGQAATMIQRRAPDPARAFNSARLGDLDEWSRSRELSQAGPTSMRYLPTDLRAYAGAFDRHGTWRHEASYGYVWYPTVTVGWRPYLYGRWRFVPAYGWHWTGTEPWAWPTHHFGRWGYHNRAWFWIPARHWSPAWVHWVIGPGFVGWCPLGFDGRPVFDAFGSNRVDGRGLYDARGRFDAAGAYRAGDMFDANGAYDPWGAWTVVSRQLMNKQIPVARHAVSIHQLDPQVRAAFVLQRTAPKPPTRAPVRTVHGMTPAPSIVPPVPAKQSHHRSAQPPLTRLPGRVTVRGPITPDATPWPAVSALDRGRPTTGLRRSSVPSAGTATLPSPPDGGPVPQVGTSIGRGMSPAASRPGLRGGGPPRAFGVTGPPQGGVPHAPTPAPFGGYTVPGVARPPGLAPPPGISYQPIQVSPGPGRTGRSPERR